MHIYKVGYHTPDGSVDEQLLSSPNKYTEAEFHDIVSSCFFSVFMDDLTSGAERIMMQDLHHRAIDLLKKQGFEDYYPTAEWIPDGWMDLRGRINDPYDSKELASLLNKSHTMFNIFIKD
jgi:hypothetical protein